MSLDSSIWVPLLALLTSIQFAASVVLVKRGLHEGDSISGTVLSIATSFPFFALAAPFAIEARYWASPAVWIFALIGLLRPSFSTILSYEGTRRLGPTIATTVESTSPLFAVLGGVVLLSERVGSQTVAGTVGVVAGVVLLSVKGRTHREWTALDLLYPFGAGLIRAGAHVGARWGLTILPSAVLSGLIAYGVSLLVVLATAGVKLRTMRQPSSLRGWKWFVLAGIFNAGAILSLNSALMYGPVSSVSPLISTFPIFTMVFSVAFYREETITRRTMAGMMLVVLSVILIVSGG